jgi:hypothetical protein
MTDPTKAKIQELCPGVMDCQVCGSNVIHNSVCMNCRDTVVVGSPITLAVVLRAMVAGMTQPGNWLVDAGGQFWEIIGESSEGDWTMKPHKVRWQLASDTYDQQSEECKQFIGSLLTNEK